MEIGNAMASVPPTTLLEIHQTNRIKYLDGWRGCAVLFVIFAHFWGINGISLGRFGVELFFVLSGRLMAEILFDRELPVSTFYFRRFSRVYPALFVFATLVFASASWRLGDPTLSQYLTAVSLTANYAQFFVGRSQVLDHVWSLCVEEHMYVLLGVLAVVHRRTGLPLIPTLSVLAAIGVSIGIWQTAIGWDYYAVYWRSDVRGASILMGAISYLAFSKRRDLAACPPWVPVFFGLVALSLNINYVPDALTYSLGTACLAISLMLVPRSPKLVLYFLEAPILLRMGVWSYSVYLWQQPFAFAKGSVDHRILYLFAAMVVALASFYVVERPVRRVLNRALGAKIR